MPLGKRRRSLALRLLFAPIPLLLLLALLEVTVRGFDLDRSCPDSVASPLWTCDPVLGFQLAKRSGTALNSDGFRSPEFTHKTPGVFRILALGDSCTYGIMAAPERSFFHIPEPYPQLLQRFSDERLGRGRVEVLNGGVPGYTSYHGVMLLRSKLRNLAPDLITVRYGWNDHFVPAFGAAATGYREPEGALALAVQDLLLRTSLYGFFRRLGFEAQALRSNAGAPQRLQLPTEWTPSLSREAYKHNLRRIVALGRAEGARVWLLISPYAADVSDPNRPRHDEFPMSPDQLVEINGIGSLEKLVAIHDDYNRALREVGAELDAPVVDMELVYRAHASQALFLSTDLPHPTAIGHALEAQTLYEHLRSAGLP